MNYYLALPTDYPAYNDDAIRAEYDAMVGQIDYVVENVSFYSHQADTAVVEADAEAALTPARARYQFEHRMLPQYFYDSPESVLNGVKEVGIYRLWESVCTENGIDPTYPAGDYVEHWYSSDDGGIIAQIEMP